MEKDEEFIKKLLSIFKVEAAEHISVISSGLFALEKDPPAPEMQKTIEAIYRSAHSLKGASRSVNFLDMETLCQSMEDLLALLRKGELTLTDDIINLLNESNDLLNEIVSTGETGADPELETVIKTLKEGLGKAARGAGSNGSSVKNTERKTNTGSGDGKSETTDKEAAVRSINDRIKSGDVNPVTGKQPAAAAETIRVSAAKLETLLMKAEELVTLKLSARYYSSEIDDIQRLLELRSREWMKTIKDFYRSGGEKGINLPLRDADKERGYADSINYLYNFCETLKTDIENRLNSLKKYIDDDIRSTGGLVDDLLSDMKNILLLPFSYVFEIYPKIVRELSREQGKEIELIIEGSDVEVDKRILQEMKDPFIHLVRNSVDHGIEMPSDRKKSGKPERGTIRLNVMQIDAGSVEIIISDDGAGINRSMVKDAALKQGILTGDESERISDDEVLDLIFESGVSTSPIITTVSGRGLGMAIVKEKAERLGGAVYVKSIPGKMTEFHIILPVAIATFRGILIETCGNQFVVPTRNVEKVEMVYKSEIITVENRATITYKGRAVSLVRLADILELHTPAKDANDAFINVMIIPGGGKFIAFEIDRVINEDEMLLKNLGNQLQRVKNISGATVLASGDVVLILNAADIIKSASRGHFSSAAASSLNIEENSKSRNSKSILVVEDSITARSLYVNILEAAGYNVTSAVDGIDGFTKLINGNFDMVVTDVQMPKMNGFELTGKIRSDARYADIPVILVTGMESTDDKKMGIDSGANAYIVKSGFDQNNLLEIIERFI